ncbi:hypothetical protein KIN20_025158 [Parelaphostrongylus tenuis]|uniref:Uncharacterized protein n=1 Tax=Parelaphostrongylus tenuis TaxID=148309 RepID=A0AAD5QWS4_PARTN|nr:hypothetical protein KIN20_025158 [Parelaphostrongylus tenuis]
MEFAVSNQKFEAFFNLPLCRNDDKAIIHLAELEHWTPTEDWCIRLGHESNDSLTTNIIMANWSIQMWQDVMNRVARSLASGPFRLQFFGVSVTVGR